MKCHLNALAAVMLSAIVMSAPPATAQAEDAALSEIRKAVLGRWVASTLQEARTPDGSATAYLQLSVTFTAEIETLQVAAFNDREMRQPLFTYNSAGPYRFRSQSAVVAGAFEADLENTSSLFTIHVDAPPIWRALNLGTCPLVVGQAVEISGCVSGPPFNTSNCVDMDLIHVEGDRLRFGDQRVDRCRERPQTLDRTIFIRAQ